MVVTSNSGLKTSRMIEPHKGHTTYSGNHSKIYFVFQPLSIYMSALVILFPSLFTLSLYAPLPRAILPPLSRDTSLSPSLSHSPASSLSRRRIRVLGGGSGRGLDAAVLLPPDGAKELADGVASLAEGELAYGLASLAAAGSPDPAAGSPDLAKGATTRRFLSPSLLRKRRRWIRTLPRRRRTPPPTTASPPRLLCKRRRRSPSSSDLGAGSPDLAAGATMAAREAAVAVDLGTGRGDARGSGSANAWPRTVASPFLSPGAALRAVLLQARNRAAEPRSPLPRVRASDVEV
uniref:Uncharacterized protein n=1 Tax=Oryza meridionalis TaxID=40149 RepID=A0A0E0CKP3_9ORYZ